MFDITIKEGVPPCEEVPFINEATLHHIRVATLPRYKVVRRAHILFREVHQAVARVTQHREEAHQAAAVRLHRLVHHQVEALHRVLIAVAAVVAVAEEAAVDADKR